MEEELPTCKGLLYYPHHSSFLDHCKINFVSMIIIVLLFLFLPMGPSPWWTTLHLVTIPTHASERQALHFGHPC